MNTKEALVAGFGGVVALSDNPPCWWNLSLPKSGESGAPELHLSVARDADDLFWGRYLIHTTTNNARRYLREISGCRRFVFYNNRLRSGFGKVLRRVRQNAPVGPTVEYLVELVPDDRYNHAFVLATMYAMHPLLDSAQVEILPVLETEERQLMLLSVVPMVGNISMSCVLSKEVVTFLDRLGKSDELGFGLQTVRNAMLDMCRYLDTTKPLDVLQMNARANIYWKGLLDLSVDGQSSLFATEGDLEMVNGEKVAMKLYSKDVWSPPQALAYIAGLAELCRLVREEQKK